MRIVIKVLPVVLATTLGCIAQSGDPSGGPDEPTGTSAQALGVNNTHPATQQQRVAPGVPPANAHFGLGNKELVSGPGTTGGGDPSQDEGDNGEPVPQPWEPHTTTAHLQR